MLLVNELLMRFFTKNLFNLQGINNTVLSANLKCYRCCEQLIGRHGLICTRAADWDPTRVTRGNIQCIKCKVLFEYHQNESALMQF